MRRVKPLLLLALLGCSFALVVAGGASASVTPHSRPNNAFNADGTLTPDAWEVIQNPARFPPPVAADGLNHADIDPVINRARVKGKILPKISDLASGSSSGGGLTTGKVVLKSTLWSIAASIGISGYSQAYHLIRGDYGTTAIVTPPATYRFSGLTWQYYTAGATLGSDFLSGTWTAPSTGWYFTSKECSPQPSCTPTAWSNVATCASGCATSDPNFDAGWRAAGGAVGAVATEVHPDASSNHWVLYASEDVFEGKTKRDPISSDTYNNYGDKITNFWPTPPSGTLDKSGAAGIYDRSDDATKGAENAIDDEVGGGGAQTFVPFAVPMPYLGETYLSYTDRLRAHGWLGSVVLADESATYPDGTAGAQLAAQSVSRVQVAGTAEALLVDPITGEIAWPENAPHIGTATVTVTLTKIADGGGGGGITGPGIDFGPLTSLDPGCKFPYGFICYATEVSGWFDVTPNAPEFDFAIHDQTVGSDTYSVTPHYDVDLSVMDDYMDIWRTLLSIVIWVGAVYFLATKLLGFGAGGDPGAAMDEL